MKEVFGHIALFAARFFIILAILLLSQSLIASIAKMEIWFPAGNGYPDETYRGFAAFLSLVGAAIITGFQLMVKANRK
jgi:hypothetical protein